MDMGWIARTPETCGLCRRMQKKDGKPCLRHGGPSRGTAAYQRRQARERRMQALRALSVATLSGAFYSAQTGQTASLDQAVDHHR